MQVYSLTRFDCIKNARNLCVPISDSEIEAITLIMEYGVLCVD